MISAFGVDHGEISKRERSTEGGLQRGAQVGLGVGAVRNIARSRGSAQILGLANRGKTMRGKAGNAAMLVGGHLGSLGIHGATGGAIGAAVGTKRPLSKKPPAIATKKQKRQGHA